MANVTDTIKWSQVPPVEETTKEHREALQQELDRVLRTAKASADYATIRADDPEVAACEKAIQDMLEHQQMKEAELQRQREEAQARTEKLLSELRAAREKVRTSIYASNVVMYAFVHVLMHELCIHGKRH